MINLIFVDSVKCLYERSKYSAEANCKAHSGDYFIVCSKMIYMVSQEQTSIL